MTPPRAEAGQPAGWAESLFTGAAGVAVLHVERARTGAAGWDTAHTWTAAMTRDPVTAHPDASGLHRGAPAVAFALHLAGRPGYAAALATLDEHINDLTRQRLTRAHQRIDAGQLPALGEYDLIRGLTGIGVYLLCRHPGSQLLSAVLSYLVRLTEPVTVGGRTLPGWWTGHAPDDRPSLRWPGGHANLGLAHGVAGPLALMSVALHDRVVVSGQADAIARICWWLDQWSVDARTGTDGVWWPETITAAELRTGVTRQPGPGRPSWCYGTPGIARAQQLAGQALADPERRRRAEHALAACLHDEKQLSQLRDATVCHGWAGLLLTVWRTAADAADPDRFPLRALGIRLDEDLRRRGHPDGAGLLEGVTGVELVQHTLAAQHPSRPRWDSCLLLAGPDDPPDAPARPGPALHGHPATGDP